MKRIIRSGSKGPDIIRALSENKDATMYVGSDRKKKDYFLSLYVRLDRSYNTTRITLRDHRYTHVTYSFDLYWCGRTTEQIFTLDKMSLHGSVSISWRRKS